MSLPAPLAGAQVAQFLLQCGVLLAVAALMGAGARRIGMPAVVGELLAGIVLGPSLLGHLASGLPPALSRAGGDPLHLLDGVAQVAVVLLVGVTGMSLDLGVVRRRGAAAMRVSVTSLVVPLALGVATGLLVPSGMLGHPNQRAVFALLIGIAMSVSAIPVIAKTLLDMRLLDRELGQMVLAAGVVDGTLGWLLLSVVSALTTTGVQPLPLAEAVASLLGVLALAPLARPAVAFVLRAAGRSEGGDGMTAAAVVAMLLLAGGATQLLGLEAVLGAFLCGAVIRSTGEAGTAALAPVRTVVLSVLAPLYFATAGLRVDLTALAQVPVAISAAAILAVAVAGKFAGAFVGATISGLSRWEAVGLGAGLNSRGIVEVVVASAGLRLGVLNGASYTAVVLVAIATSVMAPPLLRLAVSNMDRAGERRAAAAALSDGAGD